MVEKICAGATFAARVEESESPNVFSANFALGNAKMSMESASLGSTQADGLDEDFCAGGQNFGRQQMLCCLPEVQARRTVLWRFAGNESETSVSAASVRH